MTGEVFTIWSVRAAALLYVAALALMLSGRNARQFWAFGCLCYLAHVYAAFEYFHGWSHQAAYLETARQTQDLFGFDWGGGLYFNYAFTILWTADAAWWALSSSTYQARPSGINRGVHVFMAFMFFNATAVFATGYSRWFGVLATAALLLAWLRSRHFRFQV